MTNVRIPKLTAADAFSRQGYGLFAGYEAPETTFICYQASLASELAARLQLTVDRQWPLSKHPYRQLLRATRGRGVGGLLVEVGGPLTAYVIRTLAHFGTKRVVLLTSAALLTADVDCSLFGVSSAQLLGTSGWQSRPAGEPEAWVVTPPDCVPVHAVTIDHFFRDDIHEIEVCSALPCVLEMEAWHAISAAAFAGCEVEIAGYVSDRFTAAGWLRGSDHAALQERLLEIAELSLNRTKTGNRETSHPVY